MSTNLAAPRRATLQDVARRAGVGIATVDRVLNERGNVSSSTAERVLAEARALGLRRILPGLHRRILRIDVLLARPELPLIRRMGEEFGKLAQRVDRSVVIQRTYLDTDATQVMAGRILSTPCDGIVLYAQSHPEINDAIDAATGEGKAVVTISSDLPDSRRLAYAGTDHLAAGRTAGYFLGRMARTCGPVIVLCNQFSVQAHKERVRGFVEALERYNPSLSITEIVKGRDDFDLSERLLVKAARRHPTTAGIYNVGAANRSIGSVIRSGVWPSAPVFVGHELTPITRPMLSDGTMTLAIDQNPEQQARFAIDVLMHHFGHADLVDMPQPYRSDVPFTLYTPENLGPMPAIR